MANYSLVINSQFKPFSYSEMLAPVMQSTQAQQAVEDAVSKAKEHGIKELGVKIQGPGSGRETAVKSLGSIEGIKVLWFKDVTPLPHNGCRPPKRRRV